jgi:choline dehydrogenase
LRLRKRCNHLMKIECDIAIVGAGSAGCALAGRLARETNWRVVLIEAGGQSRDPWLRIPAGYYRTAYSDRYSWRLQTLPQAHMGGRQFEWPRGKTLGGSSAINGLVYIRGQAEDYRGWRARGCVGWDWDDVLPLFRRSESSWRGAGAWHGGEGPLHVGAIPMRHRLLDLFIASSINAGVPRNDDFSGAHQEGVGYFDLTTKNGFRCSAAHAYLREPLPRNLTILTDLEVRRIEFEQGRARGVLGTKQGRPISISAAGAVVLCAGSIGSPALLWASGVGPGASLRASGVAVVRDVPELGANLQDHYQVKIVAEVDGRDSYNLVFHNALRRIGAALRFALLRQGPLAAPGGQVGLFARAHAGSASPDVQFHVSPQSTVDPAKGLDRFPGFTIGVCQLRPESRGTIEFARGGPDDAAALQVRIDPAYLSAERDKAELVAGLRLALRILGQAPLSDHVRAIRGAIAPGDGDAAILDYAIATGNTVYHPAGTCRMGADASSVVDPGLKVRGLGNLYVADASIMPTLVSGNTNAPCIMIGEKASDILRRDLGGAS